MILPLATIGRWSHYLFFVSPILLGQSVIDHWQTEVIWSTVELSARYSIPPQLLLLSPISPAINTALPGDHYLLHGIRLSFAPPITWEDYKKDGDLVVWVLPTRGEIKLIVGLIYRPDGTIAIFTGAAELR